MKNYQLILSIAALLMLVSCKKNETTKTEEKTVLLSSDFIIGGGTGNNGVCFDKPCPCTGPECNGFACCKIKDGQTGVTKEACRKPGNQPIPHYSFGAISNLTLSERGFTYLDVQRIHNADTTMIVTNQVNNLGSGTELLFLDDGLSSGWASDEVTYRFFLKNSSYVVYDTLFWTGLVSE
jgi:hypothetical protein